MKNAAVMSVLFWIGLAFALVHISNANAQEPGGPSYSDPEKPIEVSIHQEFRIVLDANPTTGFLWQLSESPDEAIVKFVKEEYRIPEVPGRTGGGGKHVWSFRAVGPGQAVISLTYSRPWEKGVSPLKKIAFKINVR